METKEFIKSVEVLGFNVEVREYGFIIDDGHITNLAYVSKKIRYQYDTDYSGFTELSENKRRAIFDLLIEYASTPIDEREEEKKFYLEHRYLQSSQTNRNNILSYSESSNTLAFGNNLILPAIKNQFTLKEIEEIKEKYNTDLSDFELVEVEE